MAPTGIELGCSRCSGPLSLSLSLSFHLPLSLSLCLGWENELEMCRTEVTQLPVGGPQHESYEKLSVAIRSCRQLRMGDWGRERARQTAGRARGLKSCSAKSVRDATGKQEWFPAWRAIILCPSHNGRALGWKLFAAIVQSVSAMIHQRSLSPSLSCSLPVCLFRFPLELWVRLNMNDLSIPKNQTAAAFEFTSRIIFTFFIISPSFFFFFELFSRCSFFV